MTGLILRLLLVPPIAVLGLLGLAAFVVTVFGFPDESQRADQVALAPGVNELRVTYGAWGLPDELELRLRGATVVDADDQEFEVGTDNDASDVIQLNHIICGDVGDDSCRGALVSKRFELTVVNNLPGETNVVVEAIARDDEGIESTKQITLEVEHLAG